MSAPLIGPVLESALAEIEAHVHGNGWDRGPALFALVRAGRFTADDPATAQRIGVDSLPDDALTPVEQDDLPEQPLDELLAGIAWPHSVDGCAIAQEIVILPPSADAELDITAGSAEAVSRAAAHPDRREARLVVGVLRDGSEAGVMRLRGIGGRADDLLTGSDLAPNLIAALRDTLS